MGALGLGILGEVKGGPKRRDWKTDGTDGTDRNGFLPPAAGRDEPKARQSPFQSV